MLRRILLGLFVCITCAWTMRWSSPSVERTNAKGGEWSAAAEHDTMSPIGKWIPGPSALSSLSSAEAVSLKLALASVPNSAFKTQLLTLPEPDQLVALESVAKLGVPKEDFASLRVSAGGDLYYVCDVAPRGDGLKGREPVKAAAALKPSDSVAKQVDNVFVLHSRPGAGKVLYLDFKGGTITGTQWNTQYSVSSYTAKAYDTDGNPGNFESEAGYIEQIWIQVSEDFAPFDVDVTTERPAVFTPQTGRVMFTYNKDANGRDMPSATSGGVAFLNKFGLSDYAAKYSPAFVYLDRVVFDPDWLASTASHEFGHNLGLSHDGIKGGDEYYPGHGYGATSWCPIMGGGGSSSVDQWSRGEYYNASNTQDDLAIIATHLPYVPATAPLELKGTGYGTVPGNNFYASGVIRKSNEPVTYSIVAGAGPMKINADVTQYFVSWWATSVQLLPADLMQGYSKANLDVRIDVLDSSGTVVATAAPDDTLQASLEFTAEDKTYSVRLSSSGTGAPALNPPTGYTAYGSLGKFSLSGSYVAAKPEISSYLTFYRLVGEDIHFRIEASNFPTSYSASSLPQGLSFDEKTGAISGSVSTPGNYKVRLRASNRWGFDEKEMLISVNYPPPVILSEPATRRNLAAPGSSLAFECSVSSQDPALTYQWRHDGLKIEGATTSRFSISSASPKDEGWYDLVATNSAGSAYSKPLFVIYTPPQVEIVTWTGGNEPSVTDLSGPVTLASSDLSYGFALTSEGVDVLWGAVAKHADPLYANNAVSIIASENNSAILLSDGSVRSWFYGENSGRAVFNARNVVRLRKLGNELCVIRQDGTVVYSGGTTFTDSLIQSLENVADLSGAGERIDVLHNDGTYASIGSLKPGEVRPNPIGGVLKIATTNQSSFALKKNGTVVKAGPGDSVALADDVIDLAASGGLVLALKNDGAVVVLEGDGVQTRPAAFAKLKSVAKLGGYCALRDSSGDALPEITNQPVEQLTSEDGTVTFSVEASGGTSYILYQWRRNGFAIDGAFDRTFTLDAVGELDEGVYDVVVTTTKGSVTSVGASLRIGNLPQVLAQSRGLQLFEPSDPVDFFVTASGVGELKYQWFHNALPVPGATEPNLHLATTTLDSEGAYSCNVTDDQGTRIVQMFLRHGTAPTQLRMFNPNYAASMETKKFYSHKGVHLTYDGVVDSDGVVTHPGPYWGVDPSAYTKPVYDAPFQSALYWDGSVDLIYHTAQAVKTMRKLRHVVSIVSCGSFYAALQTNGNVLCWSSGNQTIVPGPVLNQRASAIAGGLNYGLALLADGTVVGWGSGQQGLQNVPAGLNHVKRLFALANYACAIKDTGEAVVWGDKSQVKFDLNHALKVCENYVLYEDGSVAASPLVVGFINTTSKVYDISDNGYLRDASSDKAPAVSFAASSATAGEGINYVLQPEISAGNEDYLIQWKHDGVNCGYISTPSLNLKFVTPRDKGLYTVSVSNDLGEAQATLDLSVAAGPALAVTSPVNQVVEKGKSCTLSVDAAGNGPFTYQWSRDGTVLPGENGPSLQITGMSIASAGRYRILVSDTVGQAVRLFNVSYLPRASELIVLNRNQGFEKIPDALGPVSAVFSTWSMAEALKADGTIAVWGDYAYPDPLIATLTNQAVLGNFIYINPEGVVKDIGYPGGWTSPDRYVLVKNGVGLKNDGAVSNISLNYQWRDLVDVIDITASGALVFSDGTVVTQNGSSDYYLNKEAPVRDAWEAYGWGTYILRRNGEVVHYSSEYPPKRTVLKTGVDRFYVASDSSNGINIETIDRNGNYTGPSAGYQNISQVYSLSQLVIARDAENDQAPRIAEQPKSLSAAPGGRATFSIKTDASVGVYTYQWRKGGVAIPGATGAEYIIADVSSTDAGSYDLVITSRLGSVTSAPATLSLLKPPAFLSASGPVVTVGAMSPLNLAATASGTGTLSYRWYLDGVIIPGATTASFHKESMKSTDAGLYRVEVSDSNGSNARNILVVYNPIRTRVINLFPGGYTLPLEIPDSGFDARTLCCQYDSIVLGLKTGKLLTISSTGVTEDNLDVAVAKSGFSDACVLLTDGTVWRRAYSYSPWITEDAPGNVMIDTRNSGSVYRLTADGFVSNWGTLGSLFSHAGFVSTMSGRGPLVTRWNGSVAGLDSNTYPWTVVELPDVRDVGEAYGWVDSGFGIKKDGTIITWNLYDAVPLTGKFARIKWIEGYPFGQRSDGSLERITKNGGFSLDAPLDKVLASDTSSYLTGVLLDKTNDVLPSISAQPDSTTRAPGQSVSLDAGATGVNLTYQWFKDGAAIGGATSASLVLPSIQTSDAGRYTVTASNAYGSVTSRPAAVSVGEVTPSRIKNMSVRASSGAGGSPLIVGFVMSGGAKNVLVRAIGPTLTAFGVSGVMLDPQLALHSSVSGSDVIVKTNDNWTDGDLAATMSSTFTSVGAFALSDTTSKDSSLSTPVDGSRTVHVSPIGGTQPGVVLVEAYDAGTGVSPHLINVSARNLAGSGSDTLIAGFVIDGTQPKKVLIRGIGPTLTAFGVTGVLADPLLEVHTTLKDSNNQPLDTIVATNDDWLDEPGAGAAFTAAGAFSLPAGAKDSAVVVTLPFGAYTAVVRGADGGTGEALVEVYEVP